MAHVNRQPHFVGRLLLENGGVESAKAKVNSSTDETTKGAHVDATRKFLGEIVRDKLTPARSKTTHAEATPEEEEKFALDRKLPRNKKEKKRAKKDTEKADEEMASREAEYKLAKK